MSAVSVLKAVGITVAVGVTILTAASIYSYYSPTGQRVVLTVHAGRIIAMVKKYNHVFLDPLDDELFNELQKEIVTHFKNVDIKKVRELILRTDLMFDKLKNRYEPF